MAAEDSNTLDHRDTNGWTAKQLKEFVLAILSEKDRALAMADRERELSAAALRNEQQRALDQAERERVKAAEALRGELARAIKEGDDRLREHILNQIMQINAALVSAELLERQRIDGVSERQSLLHDAISRDMDARIHATLETAEQHVEQLRRERELVTAAQQEAIMKADIANEKRFEQANEWRGQSADRERTQQEQMQKFSGTLMPREVADAEFKQLKERIAMLEGTGRYTEGRERGVTGSIGFIVAAIAFVATMLGIVIVLANVLTGN